MITLRNLCMYDEALHAYAVGVADLWTRLVVGWHILWCRECHSRVKEHRRLTAYLAAGYGLPTIAQARPVMSRRLSTLVLVATALMVLLVAMAAGGAWRGVTFELPWAKATKACSSYSTPAHKAPPKPAAPPIARCD